VPLLIAPYDPAPLGQAHPIRDFILALTVPTQDWVGSGAPSGYSISSNCSEQGFLSQ